MKSFLWLRKPLWLAAAMMLAMLFFLTACATSDLATEDTALKTPSTVPGEKSSEEPMGAPAPSGPGGAGVKW
jgi:hypothetical protein